jgi:N-acetyl-alpha-D-glucosaminyl L-malate synthase BshA
MNIGIVCYPTFGGSGVVATELGKALAQRGHRVHFITYSQPVRLDFFNENLFYHEVYVPAYPLFQFPPYELALTSKMVDIVQNEKLDVLHVHYAIPHASAAFMAKQILRTRGIQIPVVTTLHGTDITLVGKDASFEPVVTFSINQSDGVTSVSDDLRRETYEYFAIEKDITVIPNFIDLQRFRKQEKSHFRAAIAPEGEKLLIHTSNFRTVKRVEDVLRIFVGVREQIPAKLLLVGDGPDRNRMEKLARDLDVHRDLRFLMPSENESFGLAALEAMACEVPVVSTNAGGIPELNVHGVTGMISDIGDVADMVKNALYVLDDENLPRFKAAARARAEEFAVEKIVPKYEECYQRAIEAVGVAV